MRHDLQKKKQRKEEGKNGNGSIFASFSLVRDSGAFKKGCKLTRSEVLERKRERERELVGVGVDVDVGVDDVDDDEDDADDDDEYVGGGDDVSSSSSSSRRRPPFLLHPPTGRTFGRFGGDDVDDAGGRIQSEMAAFIQAIVSWVCRGKGRVREGCEGR